LIFLLQETFPDLPRLEVITPSSEPQADDLGFGAPQHTAEGRVHTTQPIKTFQVPKTYNQSPCWRGAAVRPCQECTVVHTHQPGPQPPESRPGSSSSISPGWDDLERQWPPNPLELIYLNCVYPHQGKKNKTYIYMLLMNGLPLKWIAKY
jgi:hypothetical protein